MRKKINTGLIATNGDGKPSVLPPIPAGWCRPGFIPSAGSELEGVKAKNGNSNTYLNMSTEVGVEQAAHEIDGGRPRYEGTSAASNDAEVSTNNNNNHVENINNVDDNSVEPCGESHNASSPGIENAPQSLPSIINPNTAMSEDSNVDVETEEQSAPMIHRDHGIRHEESISNEEVSESSNRRLHGEDAELSDAQYIEKQVVESFFSVNSNDRMVHNRVSSSDIGKRSAPNGNNNYEKSSSAGGVGSNLAGNVKTGNKLDAVSLTIASVAAGEGEPPEFLTRPPEKLKDERLSHHQSHHQSHLLANTTKHSE